MLEKSGFTYCETRVRDFENPTLGLRDTAIFRIPRSGTTHKELGILVPVKLGVAGKGVEEEFVPPIQ